MQNLGRVGLCLVAAPASVKLAVWRLVVVLRAMNRDDKLIAVLGGCGWGGKDTLLRKIVACPDAHFVERTQETTQKTTRLVSRGARKKER